MLNGLTEQSQNDHRPTPPNLRQVRRRGHKTCTPPLCLIFAVYYPITLLPCCLPGPLAVLFQLVPQPGLVSCLDAAHERPHSLCFELLKGLLSVPQVVLKQGEGRLSLYEQALDLDV